jgi:hypothetical protein
LRPSFWRLSPWLTSIATTRSPSTTPARNSQLVTKMTIFF